MNYRTFPFSDKIYARFSPKPQGIDADNNAIRALLDSPDPCMISRFGSVEIQTLLYVRYWPFSFFLRNRVYRTIKDNAGFYPVNRVNLRRFYQIYKNSVSDLDLLVSWRVEELMFCKWLRGVNQVKKTTMDCFYRQEEPWTQALVGKKILVVHPFAGTIEAQYKKREFLFENPKVLPEFEKLEIVKAVQSLGGGEEFASWFDALEYMKCEIEKKDFDIALLGCGAYGMPLAAHIKKMGKKAIHMGGILQFLFGIKGKRYEENASTSKYINDYFVSPSLSDRPAVADKVEGGCYW